MKKIFIALYKRTGFFSRAIRLDTWGDYSHAAGILDDWFWEVGGGRFGMAPVSCRKVTLSDIEQADLFYVSVTDLEFEAAKTWLMKQRGKPYDLVSVLKFPTLVRIFTGGQEDRESRGKWFCSELWAGLFEHIECPVLNVPPYKVSPVLLSWSPLLRPAVGLDL